MDKPLLVLFDGNAIVHRAYHAFEKRPLTVRKTGEVVSAVYGFAQMLLKVIGELGPTHCAIAFDRPAPTFRHKMYDEYKAHRPPTPAELIDQLGRVRELVSAFNIPVYELDEFEADDVLGTLSRQAGERDIDTVIVTGDADTMQLVSPHVRVLYPKPGGSFSDTILYDEETVETKYGVSPSQIADYKALKGDPSDNIPGVSGIGEKTAVKLIRQFGSIDGIYDRIDEVTPEKLRQNLRDNEAAARQSLKLATIVTDTPVTLEMDGCRTGDYDHQRVTGLLRELEFYSLLGKLPGGEAATETADVLVGAGPSQGDYKIVSTTADLDSMLGRLSETRLFAFDLETTGLDAMQAGLVGISLSPVPGEAYYVPVGHVCLDEIEQLPLAQVLDRLQPPLADPSLAKLAHNGKYDMTVLAENGVSVSNLTFDTMLAAYLLGDKSLGLKALAFARLGVEMTPITDLIGTGAKQIPMSQVDISRAGDYACADADNTRRLADILEPELHEGGFWPLFNDVEMPLVPILMDMERNGVALDTRRLGEMSRRLGEQLRKIEVDIYNAVDRQFNINSPRQLGPVLFEDLGLPAPRKTKSGYSTDAAVLEGLRGAHPVVELILEYRQLSKLKSTYIDALPSLINPKTGRVHTSFNQTRTVTGRLSSSDPNLQNIPVRGQTGREVREAFVAPAGSSLFSGDYSQIDLRVLAHFSHDESLLGAFHRGEDIHTATAAQVFGVEPEQVTPDMRRVAKTVNFGVIYGMSEFGLERATELSRQEAADFIAAYFDRYPGVKRYLEDTKEQARQSGYVETILHRKRTIPEINSTNRQLREAAERMAINMPVQGTSADIIKVAMINLYNEMGKRGLRSKMLLQVHDELVFEVPGDELETMREIVPGVMSGAMKLDVPLQVDWKTGANWGEMK